MATKNNNWSGLNLSGSSLIPGKIIKDIILDQYYQCPRCGYPVSQSQCRCPNCGQPLKWTKKSRK